MSLLWIPVTLIAAAAQTARNATQSGLIASIGTVGATQVRFLYGLPFAIVFLVALRLVSGEAIPAMGGRAFAFTWLGALAQIAATALMLAAMKEKSFAVTTALIKTEPVIVAIFGLIVLGDALTPAKALAILIATSGVLYISWKPGQAADFLAGGRPLALGLVAGACFGLAAVGFRGAILSLPEGSFYVRATTILVWGLAVQVAVLVAYMLVFDREALTKSLGVWRPSLAAGFLGALASQFWFLGFSLTTAANVRTLALVEVIMAQAVSRRLFSQAITRREVTGMALIVAGVAVLLWAAG
jgi:drug/metabolite transporter (DMT)-like permease